jgi:hypothetical protein
MSLTARNKKKKKQPKIFCLTAKFFDKVTFPHCVPALGTSLASMVMIGAILAEFYPIYI